ncbi:MAG: hypothetical protein R3Y51_07795 [Rikenellaceae bacterium]
MYEPVIKRKLTELDSALLEKKIELEAIRELMHAVSCTSSPENPKMSPM